MIAVLDYDGRLLEGRMRRIDHTTEKVLEPFPVRRLCIEKLLPGQPGGMNPDPTSSPFDEPLNGSLLRRRYFEWCQLQLNQDLVSGQNRVVQLRGILREREREVVLYP
jgi:hypothetical protein